MKLSVEVLKSLIEDSLLDYRKKNVIGKCPYCGGMEFGISIDDNHKFGCFRKGKCGEVGNIFKLLKKLNRLDLFANKDNVTITSKSYLENEINISKKLIQNLPEITMPVGFKKVSDHPYLRQRGFKDEDFKYYTPGITKLDYKFEDYIIFPIKQNERLVSYVARYTKSKDEIKNIEQKTGKRVARYKNSITDFESLLLGIDECIDIDTVILVEGLMGKRNVDEQLQLKNNNVLKCLVTFGAKISDSQILLLHQYGIRNIILFYDPDVIGYIKKYSARLADEFDGVGVALIKQQDKDPADLNQEEMLDVLNNIVSVLSFQLNVVQVLNLK